MEYRDHIYFLIGAFWVWLGLKLRLDKNGFRELRKLQKKCKYWVHFLTRGSEGVICLPPESSDKGGPESQLTSDSDPKFDQKFGLETKFENVKKKTSTWIHPTSVRMARNFWAPKVSPKKSPEWKDPPPLL